MTRLLSWFLAGLVMLGLTTTAQAETPGRCCSAASETCAQDLQGPRVALVIGNDNYTASRTGIDPLINAGNDARALAEILRGQNVSVICLIDATKREVSNQLRRLGAHLKVEEDKAAAENQPFGFVFFAGHGFSDGTDNFILLNAEPCPADAQDCSPPQGHDLGLKVSQLSTLVSEEGAKKSLRIIMVDACRTLGLPSLARRWGRELRPFEALSRVERSGEAIFLFSASDGETAVDRNDAIAAIENGLFVSRIKPMLAHAGIAWNEAFAMAQSALSIIEAQNVRQNPTMVGWYKFFERPEIRSGMPASETCGKAYYDKFRIAADCDPQARNCGIKICRAAQKFCDGGEAAGCLTPEQRTCLQPVLDAVLPEPQRLAFCSRFPPEMTSTPRVASVETKAVVSGQIEQIARASRQTLEQADRLWKIAGRRDLDLKNSADIIRGRVLRDTLLQPLRKETRAPVDLVIARTGTQPINVLPNDVASKIRIAKSSDKLTVDCLSQPCPDGWVGVRVNSDGHIYRGWIPFDKAVELAVESPNRQNFDLTFPDGEDRLDEDHRNAIAAYIQGQGRGRKLAAAVTVHQAGGTALDVERAENRVASLRRHLTVLGVPFQNVAPVIIVGASARANAARIQVSVE